MTIVRALEDFEELDAFRRESCPSETLRNWVEELRNTVKDFLNERDQIFKMEERDADRARYLVGDKWLASKRPKPRAIWCEDD